MTKVIRVGRRFNEQLNKLYQEYNKAPGKKEKMTTFTERLIDRLAMDGDLHRLARLSRRRKL